MLTQQDQEFMRRAIALSEKGALVEKSGGVFGAVIVKEGKIVGEGYNQVIEYNDPTCHAEMQAIRDACKHLKTPHLSGCILYTSSECCPMCLCAAYWAHIDHIFYAARIEDAKEYGNFDDIDYFNEIRKTSIERKIHSTELLRDEAIEVWKKFYADPHRVHY